MSPSPTVARVSPTFPTLPNKSPSEAFVVLSSRVRVYLACSLDGAIAGPDHDLSFLEGHDTTIGDALGFEAFLAQVGAMLMGRATYDVVTAMGVWPYGDLPVLVATTRPLDPIVPSVQAVSGPVAYLLAKAKLLAGDLDIYLDGGNLVRQALKAGLVDELCLTLVPTVLGDGGIRLWDGLDGPVGLQFVAYHRMGDLLQVTARPKPLG